MKRYVIGSMLGVTVFSGMTQELSSEVKGGLIAPVTATVGVTTAPADATALPEGVATDKNPLKQAYIHNSKNTPAVFRPNPSMPEIVNETVLRGYAEDSKEPKDVSQFMGYMPKMKVLPCAKGCEGRDYDRAVKSLIEGFRGDKKLYQERGEMIVQVRWFNVRPFLQRQLPYGADLFGISFMLEGKVVSLGKSSGAGKSISAYELARDIGARLGMELALSLGMGVKPPALEPVEGRDKVLAAKFMNASAALNDFQGIEDVRPRIEPATEAHAVLLPAIDGIRPNEINPIDKMYYLNSWTY
ncbi:hypothetical protein [Janthinobacterium sp. CAN_S7]|uniref:hypothetical protein n=1 Tax=Janthinobacterium sp. CAN_S7 TaxID=3071704 RepID=UPI00319E822E